MAIPEKQKGVKFVDYLSSLGFKIDIVCFHHLLYGTYEAYTLNSVSKDEIELEVKIYGYEPVIFYSNGLSSLKNIERPIG